MGPKTGRGGTRDAAGRWRQLFSGKATDPRFREATHDWLRSFYAATSSIRTWTGHKLAVVPNVK